jgi:hypothetical protein
MFRHPEVQHPASLMRQHDKDEQDAESRRWHGEKIDGRGLRQMICQEGSPSLSFKGLRSVVHSVPDDVARVPYDGDLVSRAKSVEKIQRLPAMQSIFSLPARRHQVLGGEGT